MRLPWIPDLEPVNMSVSMKCVQPSKGWLMISSYTDTFSFSFVLNNFQQGPVKYRYEAMKNKIGQLVMKRQSNILDDQQTVALLQNIRKCLPEEMLVQINGRYEKANIAGNHWINYSYVKAHFRWQMLIFTGTSNGHWSGRYASYWNAFLFLWSLPQLSVKIELDLLPIYQEAMSLSLQYKRTPKRKWKRMGTLLPDYLRKSSLLFSSSNVNELIGWKRNFSLIYVAAWCDQ